MERKQGDTILRRKFGKWIVWIWMAACICGISPSVCMYASAGADDEDVRRLWEQQYKDLIREQEQKQWEQKIKWGDSGEYGQNDAGKRVVQVENKKELYKDIGYRIKDHEEDVYYDTYTSVWNNSVMDRYRFYCNKEDLLASGEYQRYYVEDINITVEKGYFPDGHNVRVHMQFNYKFSKEEVDAFYQEMRDIAQKLKKDSDFESVKAAYDYIINRVDYDYDYNNYLDYEGFRDGVMVCSGYSMALFHLLVDMDIPVRMVNGYCTEEEKSVTAHAWNVVKIDGKWYNVDATWDDPGEEKDIQYQYFLKSDADFGNHYRNNAYEGYGKDISKESYPLNGNMPADYETATQTATANEEMAKQKGITEWVETCIKIVGCGFMVVLAVCAEIHTIIKRRR